MYQDPKLAKAFQEAIKYYFDNQDHASEYNKTVGARKYDKKYMDGLEEEFGGEKTEELDKKKKTKKMAPSAKGGK